MVTMSHESSHRSSESMKIIHGLMEKLKFMEEIRVKSFKSWQYKDGDNCSVKKMAEAGFYYSGHAEDDDSATCFVCGKVLDGWERNDQPWNEHDKHAPNCKFVRMHNTEDVLTVEEFFDLAQMLIKSHATTNFNKKLSAIKKIAENVNNCLKNQQF